jgi:hypothetical protein
MSSGSSLFTGAALGVSTGDAEGKSLVTIVGVLVGLGASYEYIRTCLAGKEKEEKRKQHRRSNTHVPSFSSRVHAVQCAMPDEFQLEDHDCETSEQMSMRLT